MSARPKTHLLYAYSVKSGPLAGARVTTTLCGIQSSRSEDGINGTDDSNKVTCCVCKAAIGNTKSWRWRRYLADNEA